MESKKSQENILIAGMFPVDYFRGIKPEQVNVVLQELYPVMSARFGPDLQDFTVQYTVLSGGIISSPALPKRLEDLLTLISSKAEELKTREDKEDNLLGKLGEPLFPFNYFANAQEAMEVFASVEKLSNLTQNDPGDKESGKRKLKELKIRAADTILFEWMARFKEMILAQLGKNQN